MNKIERLLGCHVSCAGGFHTALERARELEVNCLQMHPSPPQRYNRKPFAPGYEERFLELLPDSGVKQILFHAIYLINLATPDPAKLELSVQSLRAYLDIQVRSRATGVVVHVGSLKDEPDEERGYQRIIDVIDELLSETPDQARLLLEVSAGSGKVVGSRLDHLERIYAGVKDSSKEKIGYVLDTQHMWASGYDLAGELEQFISQWEASGALGQIAAIHLNDSKTDLASKVDRHADLGQGTIGEEVLKKVINHPKLRHIPFVLETPSLKEMEGAKRELGVLRSWAV